jgi:hypothetical protein
MSGSPERFDDDITVYERAAQDSEQPPVSTPLPQPTRGDRYRQALIDAADLDPPTTFPPY